MNLTIRIIKWIWRAWPVLAIIGISFAHLLLLKYLDVQNSKINSLVSLSTQIVGGLIVLYSIDTNIWLFKKGGLIGELKAYFLSFPLIKRNITISLEPASFSVKGGDIRTSLIRNPKTVEEHIEYLQEQIDGLVNTVDQQNTKLSEEISELDVKFTRNIGENSTDISEINKKLKVFAIGGLKLQFLGVLLVIYGGVAGYYS